MDFWFQYPPKVTLFEKYALKFICTFRALEGLEVRALGPWKSNGALVKYFLRAQWTPQNWRISNVFQWRDPSNFAWGPWKFKWWSPEPSVKTSTESPDIWTQYKPIIWRIRACHGISIKVIVLQEAAYFTVLFCHCFRALLKNENTRQNMSLKQNANVYQCLNPMVICRKTYLLLFCASFVAKITFGQ